MNENPKKAMVNWTNRLFRQAAKYLTVAPDKTYYLHRYHNDKVELNIFSALFADAGKNQPNPPIGSENPQLFLGNKSLASKDDSVAGESSQAFSPNVLSYLNAGIKQPSGAIFNGKFKILNIYDETPEVKTFRLGCQHDQVFEYLPGQYITLSVVIGGRKYKRSFSLASTPSWPFTLEITVKRVPNGVVSNWLCDNAKIGDVLDAKGPFGKFSCVRHAPEKILFLAAGSGIVPVMSMLCWLADTEAGVDVQGLLSFRTYEDIIYREELKLLVARHKNIKLTVTLTTDALINSGWSGYTGRVNEKMIREIVADLPQRHVYVCGPDLFMEACKKIVLNLKLPENRLFTESFTVNSAVTSPAGYTVYHSLNNSPGRYQVRFARSGITTASDGQVTLLELAEQTGISLDHECRNGSCGECMIKCLKGAITMTDKAEIDDRDRRAGWVYTCCAYPASDIVLDI
ncbi:MAG: FAD-binding oxidoreductase [Methylobacter sp.]